MKKYILSLILFFIAVPVYAEVLYSQLIDNAVTADVYQIGDLLPSSMSGDLKSVYFNLDNNNVSAKLYVVLYRCSTVCLFDNSSVSTWDALYSTTTDLVAFSGMRQYSVDFDDVVVLDSSKYYALVFQYLSGVNPQLIKMSGGSGLSDTCRAWNSVPPSVNSNCSPVNKLFYVLDDESSVDLGTRIISVTPYDGEVVASTTPTEIGFEAYINGDYPKSTLTFKVQRLNDLNDYGGMSGQIWEYSTTTNEVGPISYSKIVPSLVSFLDPGNYILTLDIRPSTIFSFFTPTSVATSTMFYVGDATRFGLDYAKSQDEYRDFFSDISQSATSSLADFCDFTSPLGGWLTGGLVENTWDIGKCLRSLLVPNALEVKAVFDSYKGQVLYAFPLGYVTRSIDIMTGTTTLPLPALTYTFENDFPSAIFAGKTFGFDFTEIASDASDILDTQFVSASDDKTVWEIFEPYIRTVFAFLLAWLIIVDLMSIELNTGFGSTVGSAYRQGRTVIKRKWRDL